MLSPESIIRAAERETALHLGKNRNIDRPPVDDDRTGWDSNRSSGVKVLHLKRLHSRGWAGWVLGTEFDPGWSLPREL
jgi:hypothetical protein